MKKQQEKSGKGTSKKKTKDKLRQAVLNPQPTSTQVKKAIEVIGEREKKATEETKKRQNRAKNSQTSTGTPRRKKRDTIEPLDRKQDDWVKILTYERKHQTAFLQRVAEKPAIKRLLEFFSIHCGILERSERSVKVAVFKEWLTNCFRDYAHKRNQLPEECREMTVANIHEIIKAVHGQSS